MASSRIVFLIALALTVSMRAPLVRAAENRALQELFQTETVFPQEEGETQITLAPVASRGQDEHRDEANLFVEYGITDAFQIEAAWASYVRVRPLDATLPRTEGIGDFEIGARYSWMDISGSNIHATFGTDFTIPTGSDIRGTGEGHYSATPVLVLAADMLPWPGAQAVANIGSEISLGAHGGDKAVWLGNLAFFGPIGDLTLTTELNVLGRERYATPGVIWHLKDGLEAGVGVPIGLNRDSDRYRIVFVVTWEFGGR
jgi:hypothetical protein